MTQPSLFEIVPPASAPNPVRHEFVRRAGNAAKVLARLQLGSATGDELDAIAGRRFGARLLELRSDGWQIERVALSQKLHRYTLKGMK